MTDKHVHLKQTIYREDFESGELNGWASYPPCQDTAYNPYVYPGKIRPGDKNICFVAYEDVHWHEDQFLGGVKLLDLFLDRKFSLKFRYFFKTVDSPASLEVHFPIVTGERLLFTIKNPPVNRWVNVVIGWKELKSQNAPLAGKQMIRISALAFQARITKADPDMPVYFGFDDVELSALEESRFNFIKPETVVLSEWKERIPLKHFHPEDRIVVEGSLDFRPDKVFLDITSFTERETSIHNSILTLTGSGMWKSRPVELGGTDFPIGLYRGKITAESAGTVQSTTFFTFFVTSPDTGKRHPRLFYDEQNLEHIRQRFTSKRFNAVRGVFVKEAKSYREKVPADTVVYDFDQFPVKNWIESLWDWFVGRIMNFREALYTNAVVYSLLGDREAGEYCKKVMLALADFPLWNHPWMENRGFHSYFPPGEMAEAYALAYDLTYDILTENERSKIREGIIRNYVKPAYITFVEQNRITVNTSNWISHIAGGALMALTAQYCDDSEPYDLEPWLTGFIIKAHKFINTVFGRDGSYGEGFRYYNFAMQSFARIIPMMERIYGVDLSAPVLNSYRETLWAGIIKDNILFTFGDSQGCLKEESQAYWIGGQNGPMNNWAWLVARSRDPHLSWLYRNLKSYDTLEEVLYETDDVPAEPPDKLDNVAFFRDVGTAVFKSGWNADDFVFVFRSGPFYNHQHKDQGSFFLADHGRIFLEERYDGDHHYYDDPVYMSHAIQTISHNTILFNENPQSQEVGDPKGFAAGMRDHAEFASWFDSESFAYTAGRLDGVYKGAVKELWRHVLYIKPRTVLLVDRIVPGKEDVKANLLFHTQWKKDIKLSEGHTEFHRDGSVLFMYHLSPRDIRHDIKSEPHFLFQFKERPLTERGYLQLSAKTAVTPLVMANLMTATCDGKTPDVNTTLGNGWAGADMTIDGLDSSCAVNTASDTVDYFGFKTDALIIARSAGNDGIFIADGTYLTEGSQIILSSENSIVAHIVMTPDSTTVSYFLTDKTEVSVITEFKPGAVKVNGDSVDSFDYDGSAKIVTVELMEGKGELRIMN